MPFFASFVLIALVWPQVAIASSKNIALGPLELRDQFPVTLSYLSMAPDTTGTLKDEQWYVGYQMTVTNTFLNSEGGFERNAIDRKGSVGRITKDEVNRGLTAADFSNSKTGKPFSGFRVYIDVESYRHQFLVEYGLSDSVEIGWEIPYVAFSGGMFDETVEVFHEMVGIDNNTQAGAYRSLSDRNRYDFYVVKDGEMIIADDEPFAPESAEHVFHLKWNITEGGDVMPAIATKVSYKVAASNRSNRQKMISSGTTDVGSWLLLSKGFDPWYVYLGVGSSILGTDEDHEFSSTLQHRFVTLEYQWSRDLSFIVQALTQSSIFSTSGPARGTREETSSVLLSNSTEFMVLGYKQMFGDWKLEVGFLEDYYQTGNQTDVALYGEIGYSW